MSRNVKTFAVAALLLAAMAVHEARAGGVYFYYGPSYYPAPVVHTVTVHRPVVYAPPVYYYSPPAYQPIVHPVRPVVYTAPAVSAYPVRVRYKRREIETKYYTPYGTHEYEVKFDRYGRVRDVDYDFDD